jgi:hypothetical protein
MGSGNPILDCVPNFKGIYSAASAYGSREIVLTATA